MFSIIGIALATASALIALYAMGRNWLWVRHRRRKGGDSPVLLVGPLFALIAAGLLAQAVPSVNGWKLWLFPVTVSLLDPAAVPLIVGAWLRPGGNDRGT